MNSILKKYALLTLSLACFSMAAACGSDEGPNTDIDITPTNNQKSDAGVDAVGDTLENPDSDDAGSADVVEDSVETTDVDENPDLDSDIEDATDTTDGENGSGDTDNGDTSTEPDGTTTCTDECAVGFQCIDGQCVQESAAMKCDAAQDLGELQQGTPITVTGSLRSSSDVLPTACGPGSDQADVGGEAIFTFTVAETSLINFDATWNGQFDGVIAFRTDSCVMPGSAMDPCFDREEESFRAEAGHTYYMIVELAVGRGNNFSIDLTATEAGCLPGTESCTGDVLTRCEGSGVETQYACAESCSDSGVRCQGTTCDEAITVTASTTFSGNSAAHSSIYDFQNFPGCEVDGTLVNTPGQEVLFFLPDLDASQIVTIDTATDENNNAIFIASDCSTTSLTCVATDYINESLTWTVPSNGSYYIFIDKASNAGDVFQYSIDIQ